MRFIICFVILVVLFSAGLLSGCECERECLDEPVTDTTPPTAGVLISYYVDGNAETKTISYQDPGVTIYVDADSDIVVVYSGQDEEGMRSLYLYASYYRYPSPIVVQQGHFGIDPITTSCPTDILMGDETFQANGVPGKIVLKVESENWVGLTTSTPSIVLRY